MDNENNEDVYYVSRFRSPTFSCDEVNAIIELVEKYKLYVLNKSIMSAACHAKESAWIVIEKEFNKRNLGYLRSAETLKGKWENLKRDVRKLSKNLMDNDCSKLDAVQARVLALLSEAENMGAIDVPQDILQEDSDKTTNEEPKDTPSNYPNLFEENVESDEEVGGVSKNANTRRSKAFTSEECNLLLQCVTKEKSNILSKQNTKRAVALKNRAWTRVAYSYNKLSPQKRSPKTLQMKFTNLKNLARRVVSKDYFKERKPNKREKTIGDSSKTIKKEPLSDEMVDDASESFVDNTDHEINGHDSDSNDAEATVDPLASVLNSDSGIGSSRPSCSWDSTETKEIIKLKKELLEYQMETAKLERKRIELLMQEEASLRESRAAEAALRLRTHSHTLAHPAPHAHPAPLAHTPEQHYRGPYHG